MGMVLEMPVMMITMVMVQIMRMTIAEAAPIPIKLIPMEMVLEMYAMIVMMIIR